MISRPSARAVLAGLLFWGVAACSQDPAHTPRPGAGENDAAVTRLLAAAQGDIASGALAGAGQKLDEARSLAPESSALWLAIARLRLRGGEHLTAVEANDRALALDPGNGAALHLRALLVRDAHGGPAAKLWFDAARQADPGNPDILAEYAATLGDSGEAGAMLDAVGALAAAAPDDPRIAWFQAVLAARGGQFAIARSRLTKSAMAARGVPAVLLLDAVLKLQEGNAESAADILDTLARRQPANPRLRELLARALLEAGREEELVRRFGPEAALPETSSYLVMLVARAHERLGDRAAAAPLLARAYAPVPADPVLLASREGLPEPTMGVRRALWATDGAGAAAQAKALRARLPASADIAVLAGDAMLGSGDPRAALMAFALASEARRPWPVTRKAVWTFARHGKTGSAEALLLRQVAGEPQTASAVLDLAARQAARGEWRRTALLLDHALALGAGHDPALLDLRLRAARGLGNKDDAERFAALLAELRPRSLAARR